uniref:C-type lectin domain-containing protein n=1 Tax=Dicentrarchus labrax TaxID=13489 RepID=A0A8P4K9Z9_DICLA
MYWCIMIIFVVTGRGGSPETKILVEIPMKWIDAQYYCRVHHTDLFSVRNQAENQEIQSMVPAGKLTWIGLFGDSWKWSDGSNSLYRFQWQGSLDNLGEGPNCAHFYNRKWSVRSCHTKSMFLCHYFKKRSVLRISTDFDMSDPDIQQQILNQLEAEMKNNGISDFKISWRMSFTHKQSTVSATDGSPATLTGPELNNTDQTTVCISDVMRNLGEKEKTKIDKIKGGRSLI